MKKLEKGKKIFLTMAIILLAISLISALSSYFINGGADLISGIIRTILEGILLYFTFKGKKWAKITMIVILSIVLCLLIFIVVQFSFDVMSISAIVVYAGSIYVIAFSPSVKEYLKSIN